MVKYSDLDNEIFSRNRDQLEEEYRVYKILKQRQKQRFMLLLILAVAAMILILSTMGLFDSSRASAYFAGLGLVAAITFLYLQPETRITPYQKDPKINEELFFLSSKNRELEKQNKLLNTKIDEIINQIKDGGGGDALFNKEDKRIILEKIQAKLESESLAEYKDHIISLVEQKLSSKSYDRIFDQTAKNLGTPLTF